MRRKMKKAIAVTLSMSMTMSLLTMPVNTDAAKKVKLSKKFVTLAIGESSTIKIKNVNVKKVKELTLKSNKKKIVTVKRSGNKKNSFKVTGKAEGNAKIQVKLYWRGQKKVEKLTLKVKVAPMAAPTEGLVVAPTATAGETTKPIASMSPTATPKVTISAGETMKPIASVTPTATPKVTMPATETTEPIESMAPTVAPEVTPKVTIPAGETVEPIVSEAPTEKPFVEPVVTPETTNPVSETAEPTASVAPTAMPTATPVISETDTLQLESVMVTENRELMIFFNEPSSIIKEDLVIKTKNTVQDSYGEALAVKSIEKIDPLQYAVVLDTTSENYIVNNGYAQVSVVRTSGKSLVTEDKFECEFETTTREWIQSFTVGTAVGNIFMNMYNEDFVGALQYEVIGDMPDGLSYWLSGKNLYVRGTPEKVGTYKFVVDVTDEVGNNLVYNCTYLVGDAENLYAVSTQQYVLVGEEEEAYVVAIGGSGTYTYTKVEGDYDFTVDSDGEVTAEFSEPGTYKLYVDVADAENTNLTTRVEVVYYVEATCNLSGKVTDLGGSNIQFLGGGLRVYVIPQDREIQYRHYLYKPMADLEQANSTFSIDVPAGIYDVRFESNYGSVYKVIKDVEVKDSSQSLGNVELPVCQVNLETPNEDNLYQVYWRDEEGTLIGRNAAFLVHPGTYTLHSDPDISPVMASLYDFTVTFTATDDSVYKVVTATPTGDRIKELTLGNEVDVSLDSAVQKWYKFTPTETGKYHFYSTGLDESMYFGVYSDKQYDKSHYFYLTVSYTSQSCSNAQVNRSTTLEAGTNYYILLDMVWSDTQDDFVFGVEKVE